ncbi:RagB/SusD family nutrient uptake outer membrane protein [Pedobacter lithocola]|uniref:RagB/SusD family nutrient uptake outer membrane protein n=1 Tax=Pedobacter lithocola TaxID=1908239 RepID=A0ABV8PAP1_9SPHI
MKKSFSIYLFLVCLVAFQSCKKFENEPKDLDTYDIIFDPADLNAVRAQEFLNNIYTFLPTGFARVGGDFLDAATDDAVSIVPTASITYYTNGIVSVVNNPDQYFSNAYFGIRQANIFLANSAKIPVPAGNPIRTKRFNAEARFIRAFLYFQLLQRYGGVPLISDNVFTLNDNLQLKRNTFEECVNYIASECDAIKPNLYPDNDSNANNFGRIVQGAAVALKCRLYLYAASPLFNGGGIEADAELKKLTGYLTIDITRWQKVVDAVAEFKALGNYYSLQTGAAASGYRNIFINKKNSEVIFAKQSVNNFDIENNNAPVGYVGFAAIAGGGRTNPTQNFVDAFTTINGKPISQDLKSTTNPNGYDPASPYANRDPRFYVTVFFSNANTPSAASYNWLNRAVETFEGGRDKPNNNLVTQTRTGYYLRKFMGNFVTGTTYSQQSHNFIYFRYAEILLNNAEALNELGGRTEDAVKEIIEIRRRAGINAGTDARYGIPPGISQAAMRDIIRNERRIELSFEEHRFFDVRRWKNANTELNKTLTGMKITREANGSYTHEIVPVVSITFQDKLYHNPFPYDETVKNSALRQNFGW